jgi:signal transduction histidine kinase
MEIAYKVEARLNGETRTEKTRILLIEDDPVAVEMTRAFLGNEGERFHLEWRNRLQDGLVRLSQGGIDLVLLDFSLPDSDGIETFEMVYQRAPEVAIIPLTAVRDEELAVKAIQMGAQDYIFKGSIDQQVLLRSIRYAIERKRTEEELRRAHDELERRVLERTKELSAANERLREQISERQRAEDELRRLSNRLVDVQERERRSIARELHDEIGQLLTGLKLALETAALLPADAAKARIDQTLSLVNELMGRIRELSLDLRPAMLDDLGLLPALLWHFERYSTQTGVRVIFKHSGIDDGRLNPGVETATYRIVQEALTNVARYARVNDATVTIFADAENLTAQIEDQGMGFDPSATLAATHSSGLTGMRERAQLVGGTLSIESAPSRGTQIYALLPLNENEGTSNDRHTLGG